MNVNDPVLIVEDDANEVHLLRAALQQADIPQPVWTVSDGKEAVDYLCGHGRYKNRTAFPPPTLIFTELDLPRLNGFAFLRWIKTHPAFKDIPTIVLTNSTLPSDMPQADECGADDYLLKPSSFSSLVSLLQSTIAFWASCARPPKP